MRLQAALTPAVRLLQGSLSLSQRVQDRDERLKLQSTRLREDMCYMKDPLPKVTCAARQNESDLNIKLLKIPGSSSEGDLKNCGFFFGVVSRLTKWPTMYSHW